jgi:hypothetical protein
MAISFNAAQIIYNLLNLRDAIFFLLLFSIFQQQKGYYYGILVTMYIVIPNLSAEFSSGFMFVFYIFVLALLNNWESYIETITDWKRNRNIVQMVVVMLLIALSLGAVWQGGVKRTWRGTLANGNVSDSVIDKSKVFAPIVSDVVSTLTWRDTIDSTAERISSSAGYFWYVLQRVPTLIPYENGNLTSRALKHTIMPRIIFPNKPNLGSDSWLVQTYAGVQVAGEKEGTSVGLGYMVEFYIDYGPFWMFVPLFLYGMIVGLMYGTIYHFSPSRNLAHGVVVVILLQNFIFYEGEIAKLLGGIAQAFVISLFFLVVISPSISRYLLESDQVEEAAV